MYFNSLIPRSLFLSLSFQTYFTFDSRAEQQTEVYLRYGQHPELYPNRRGEVVQGCVYVMRKSQPETKKEPESESELDCPLCSSLSIMF